MPFDACYHAAFYCDICFKKIDGFGQSFADAKKEVEELGWKIRKSAHIALCPDHIKATKQEIEQAHIEREKKFQSNA